MRIVYLLRTSRLQTTIIQRAKSSWNISPMRAKRHSGRRLLYTLSSTHGGW